LVNPDVVAYCRKISGPAWDIVDEFPTGSTFPTTGVNAGLYQLAFSSSEPLNSISYSPTLLDPSIDASTIGFTALTPRQVGAGSTAAELYHRPYAIDWPHFLRPDGTAPAKPPLRTRVYVTITLIDRAGGVGTRQMNFTFQSTVALINIRPFKVTTGINVSLNFVSGVGYNYLLGTSAISSPMEFEIISTEILTPTYKVQQEIYFNGGLLDTVDLSTAQTCGRANDIRLNDTGGMMNSGGNVDVDDCSDTFGTEALETVTLELVAVDDWTLVSGRFEYTNPSTPNSLFYVLPPDSRRLYSIGGNAKFTGTLDGMYRVEFDHEDRLPYVLINGAIASEDDTYRDHTGTRSYYFSGVAGENVIQFLDLELETGAIENIKVYEITAI